MNGLKIQFAVVDEITPLTGDWREEAERHAPTPNCFHCGRFCAMGETTYAYDGQGTQAYVSVHCSFCGDYTESLW